MQDNDKPVVNSLVVLREEFDDWAILFDPDTGNAFGVNPVAVFVWKRLDAHHTIRDIYKALQKDCEDVPKEAKNHIKEFIEHLIQNGFAEHKTHEV